MVNESDDVLIFGLRIQIIFSFSDNYSLLCKEILLIKNIPLLALKYELIVSSSFCQFTVH